MRLDYLDFDCSEDSEGVGTFDALASTTATQLPAVHAEIETVLAWAHGQFPEGPGAVADGADWDIDLQSLREYSAADTLTYDPATGRLRLTPGGDGEPRHTTSLSISGSAAFSAAFRDAFELD
ncbi:hypothetical protein [Variovorax ginsengisoli]|uniref:Uncharacterized protein n=1 Tax=Variovorax ginsengisoli TaxID=363844 RepID=A0ABT9S6W5_9BURK|nr:hypothetical protein [Variovorax ginsengisoli]MDP9899057.1 hypothetical protein [Variovorax ginsengisoli]